MSYLVVDIYEGGWMEIVDKQADKVRAIESAVKSYMDKAGVVEGYRDSVVYEDVFSAGDYVKEMEMAKAMREAEERERIEEIERRMEWE